MNIKKFLAAASIPLVLASCSPSPQELKETYFEQMQEYGVSKGEAIDSVDTLCEQAIKGEGNAAQFMERVHKEGGRFEEIVGVIVQYGVPAYCPKFADDFKGVGI